MTEITTDHEKWLAQALVHTRAKRYDEARELALRVLREDGSSVKALWIVATTTNSLNERRNALNQLLRIQPENVAARQMLQSVNETAPVPVRSTKKTYPSLAKRSAAQPVYLYAAVASLLLVVISTVSAAFIF